jgi:1-acyl-sn-glycerol-3-phosphate acyltransferase
MTKLMAKRRFGRTRAFAGLAKALCQIPFWLLTKPRSLQARMCERAFFARIAESFGIKTDVRGLTQSPPATLYIMNHISWVDIPVMMAILDADFVAKADLLDWPLIGRLARRFDPVFVTRHERHLCRGQVEAIRERLSRGRSVILCAEGTTSDGNSILPFRTSLLAAADEARCIQPVVLNYLTLDGRTLTCDRQRAVAWIDDDALLAGAARVAQERTLARVEFLSPVSPGGLDRKRLAETVRERMLAAYAAAPNRPKYRSEIAATGMTMKTSTVLNW